MNRLRDLFRSKGIVFVTYTDKVGDPDKERNIRLQLHEYIKASLGSFLFRKRIRYIDFFNSKTSMKVFTVMTTFDPKKNKRFLPAIYEIYAFTQSEDERIFDCYESESKVFADEYNTIKVIRFKL